VIGLDPVKVAQFERDCAMIKALMNGEKVAWNGKEIELTWARERPTIPLYVAGYGPKALGVAGRVGDGVIIQLADPVIIEWIMSTARAAAEQAGRDPDALECIVGAPSKVSDDLGACREEVRWFPAMVSNHVMDLIERYGWDSDIPSELTDFVKARTFYDYGDHSRVGAAHGEFVTDEICDRFCVIGSAAQCVEKLRSLEAVGVDQFNVYLMTNGQDETLAAYGREIIPQVAGAASR
jgi:alkanesulfonate monooxygenase SsuD/methylene tetrahydromethanopterin reductase-like flavin-dependent oxidoreductase (luciferase family)